MTRKVLIALSFFLLFFNTESTAANLSARAVVEKTDVYLGEPFIFQIQVNGSENPEKPELSAIEDFTVEFLGGKQNSSRSVTIINNKVTQDIKEGYFFSYNLTPKRTGRLVIPPITVLAGGRSLQTDPITINVGKPSETDDFKLRLTLSKDHCYVGEPVILTVTWYIGKDVKEFKFTLPVLKSDSFQAITPEMDTASGKKYYHIPIGDDEAVGTKDQDSIGGREYTTITFEKVLIPKVPGKIEIDPATVACSILTGYERQGSPFGNDSFPDFFNMGRRGIYKTVVVSSNSLPIRVSDLPIEGRPRNFSGLVGEYRLEAQAKPVNVNVGDPITLTLTLSGPDYLEDAKLPSLMEQPELVRNFKIPKEQATAEMSGRAKVFTQTIRALSQDVKEIPPISVSFFDTGTGSYRMATTDPIPITVKATKIVTALDAEGMATPVPTGNEIETLSKGITFNYEDMDVIKNQSIQLFSRLRSPLWMFSMLGPMIFYLFLAAGTAIIRRRNADPMKTNAKKAYGRLKGSLEALQRSGSKTEICDIAQNAFRHYLGDKLGLPKGSLTFNDVKEELKARGVDDNTLKRLKDLFDRCEAGRYAGEAGVSDVDIIKEQVGELARELEKRLR